MSNFCRNLSDALYSKFNLDIDVFVSKKKKLVHLSLRNPLMTYLNYKEIPTFIARHWKERKHFCSPYILQYPSLNQSIKWRYDYIIASRKRYSQQQRKNGCSVR